MRFASIASGSSGNCIYIGTDHTHILVDAGISSRRIEQGLSELGVKPSELSGILITHEHSDHVGGLGVFSRRNEVPIYTTKETFGQILRFKNLGQIPEDLYREVIPDEEFTIGDMRISPFSIERSPL